MRYLESETLPTGVEITAKDDINSVFHLSDPLLGVVVVSKHDIARMYGIAYPDNKHICCNVFNNAAVGEQTNIETNNSDIYL